MTPGWVASLGSQDASADPQYRRLMSLTAHAHLQASRVARCPARAYLICPLMGKGDSPAFFLVCIRDYGHSSMFLSREWELGLYSA